MSLVEKSFKNGEIIIREGEEGKSFFRIIEGNAYVISDYEKKDQLQLAILNPGEYFGEMAIIETYPRSATVISKGNSRVVEISEDELNKYLSENPEEIIALMKHLGNRIRAMTIDYNDSVALLKELRESDAGKKASLFSKIKKHINMYQLNKNKLSEPSAEALRETLENTSLDGYGTIETYPKGTIIFKEGEEASCMYILHVGAVGIYSHYGESNQVKLTELTDASFFGEMGMLAEEPRSATAVSEDDTTYVEIIYPEDLEALFKNCPVKIDMLLRHLSHRLRQLNNDFLRTCKEITETYDKK